MKKLFIQLKRGLNGCDVYRAISPAKSLKPVLRDYGIDLILEYDFTRHQDLEATITQRKIDDELIVYLMERQSRGMKLCYETDDAMLQIPDWSPVKQFGHNRNEIIANIMIADRIWCSTKPLANSLSNFPGAKTKRAIVLPNLVDLNSWGGGQENAIFDEEIRIAWAGTMTHEKDLELLTPVLDVIFRKYPHVMFCYMGQVVPAEWIVNWHDRITHWDFVPVNLYPRQLKFINPHIALCPLVDEPFNRCKSAAKALEATLAGAAVVASPLPPYQIEQDPIWSFASTTYEWIEAISELVEDHEKRRRQQGKALEVVHANYSWQRSKYTQVWLAAMLDLMDVKVEVEQPAQKPSMVDGIAQAMQSRGI